MSLDIVSLIESNPIARFNQTYHSKIIDKLSVKFSNYDEKIFLSNFYCYLKYDKVNDFVIDLDNIWKYIGFRNKANAKRLLRNSFIIEKDYKILHLNIHEKDKIMLNIQSFKKLCVKSFIKKGDEIYDYFSKLEEVFYEILLEEVIELRAELLKKSEEFNELRSKLLKKSEEFNELRAQI
jgi:hypothetical protein